jgi:tRNA pseudouridine55 synthase
MRLGLITDSLDITGTAQESRNVPAISQELLESVIAEFEGEIEQIPPMFSALKKNGVPLYRLARNGEEVERQKRPVSIYRIALVACEAEEVVFDIECSKGTYIRTLCHDIGLRLGCGACMTQLRRTSSGHFSSANLITLDALRRGDFTILSPLEGLSHLPQLELNAEGRERLRDGIPPWAEHIRCIDGVSRESGQVLLCAENKLIAVASPDFAHQHEHRGDFKLNKVFPDGI